MRYDCPKCGEQLTETPSGQTCFNGCIGILPIETHIKGATRIPSYKPGPRKVTSLPGQQSLFDTYDDSGSHD